MQQELRQTCRRLLEDGQVQVVIGFGGAAANPSGCRPHPLLVTRAADADSLVWNDDCRGNLVKYLLRDQVRALGRSAIVVKAADLRALVVLQQESQIDRGQIVVIGMACSDSNEPSRSDCATKVPEGVDILIGSGPLATPPSDQPYQELDDFLRKTPDERMAYWKEELSRCVKCYACRQACPLCYCRQCIVEKNRPTCIDTSATLKGNFAWHIARAFHLAGRCVGCGACSQACPAEIDLRLLNLSLARAAEDHFGYRAGLEPQSEPPLGGFSPADREAFIR